MKLEPEQESILAGESGRALALAMQTLVSYGDSFSAPRLVPVKSAHLAGSFGAFVYKAYFRIVEQLLAEGAGVKVHTTVNPRPGRSFSLANRVTFATQPRLERWLERLGVFPNYSCVCYERDNVPKTGDPLAWAESSAVQYANSVLGARTNRNSVLIDLCSAVTGYTPEFGYLLDENRRGRLLIKLQVKNMDASALGYIVGREAVDRVPVIEHHDFSRIELKNMGGAMAASGAVALFHVEGLTPEAPDMKTVFEGEPKDVITITQDDLDSLRNPREPDMVVLGCPQMTYDEAVETGPFFADKRVKAPTYFCMAPGDKERFEKTELGQKVVSSGVKLFDFCPLAALTVRRSSRRVLTNSGKLYYYLAGTDYGSTEDCLKACGVAP